MTTLYTFGYLSAKGTRILSELHTVGTPIVDVRFSPTSKRREWTQRYLQTELGASYTWVQDLGNEWYKDALTGSYTEPHVKLHCPDKGIRTLEAMLIKNVRVAIFCACSSPKNCHRSIVANLAQKQIPELKVVHL